MKGIGIDIVEVERIAAKCGKKKFVDLVFTVLEQQYCESQGNKAQSFAARFAAKEAYMKAVGLGWTDDAQFHEIEITNGENGQPIVKLHGNSKAYFDSQGYVQLMVTLSHTRHTAVAVVVVN